MKITYLGQCGFIIENDGVQVVTDPYLSDSVDRLYYSESTPWKRNYPAPVALENINPDLILISHGHGDHMDPDTLCPYRKNGGTAPIIVPLPEMDNIAKWGVDGVIGAKAEDSVNFGNITVTPVACAHTQLHTNESGHFYELSYLIDFGNGERVFFGGDFSLYDGIEKRLQMAKPSLLLLPANGRDDDRTSRDIIGNTTPKEAAELAARLGIPWIPMHHDLYEINRCAPHEPADESIKAGAKIVSLKPMESYAM